VVAEKSAPVFVIGPGQLMPGERKESEAAARLLREIVRPIAERHGGIAVMNALISLWLDVSLAFLGVAETQEQLRLLRRDVPKFAAALRASKAEPEGRA
jgi:hypothetical protein